MANSENTSSQGQNNGQNRGPNQGRNSPQENSIAGDDLVQRARREIAEIIREVAALARKSIDRSSFFAALVDRTVCAIAAEGAVIWDCSEATPIAIVRTGRITDASIGPFAVGTHHCLLREIAVSQAPAVVPATPDATDPNLPNNPTSFPAALVPILDLVPSHDDSSPAAKDHQSPSYVLEVFLEGEAGVSTQRGYLRFIAQMSDLASVFLQADEIRLARSRESMRSQFMEALDRLHRLETSSAVAAEIVDSTADMFAVARVSLAMVRPRKSRLIAVSHVESIDHRGETCRLLLREIDAYCFTGDRRVATDFDQKRDVSTSDSDELSLSPFAVTRNTDDSMRMLLQHTNGQCPSDLQSSFLNDWSRQALAILSCRLQFESIPLAKAYLAISPEFLSMSPTLTRRLLTIAGGLIAMTMIAMIPTPMVVTMPASLRPEGARTHYAPSDAVVDQVAVKHGQAVQSGDVLVRLRDWALEEQVTTLVARRAVVNQRLSRSIASLVEAPVTTSSPTPSHESTTDDELVQQQRLLEEELAGLNEQIELLDAARDRLTIRADRAGRVDAWQTELTATGRPVHRGDSLVRVEPDGMRWMADARIDQSRVSLVLDQIREDPDTILKVATVARPERSFQAKYLRRELAIIPTTESIHVASKSEGSLGIELAINRDDIDLANPALNIVNDESWTNGSPASVAIDCGKRPLFQVLFFDLVRAARRTWARWV